MLNEKELKNMTVENWLGQDNQIGIDIWNGKYRYNNESFSDTLDRIGGNSPKMKQLLLEKKFLFGGRIMANRGLDEKGLKVTLSNCYVIEPPEDSIESIFECGKKLARTFSYGGGCGVDISKLAPVGAKVNNTARKTTGSVSFMDFYSYITGLIGQNGRRGALMLSLDCNHPDIEDFVTIKSDLNKVTKANISVKITDEFMNAVKNDADFSLSFTRTETGETITKTVNAKELFHKMAEMNWDYAEPGMLFWNTIEKHNLLANTENFHYAGTNPCAEEPLPAGGSCLLGSLNLAAFVNDKKFNWNAFKSAVYCAVEELNQVLDEGLMLHPLQEQKDSVREWRQIGLGVMGIADMLIKMEIRYGSPEAVNICKKIAKAMLNFAMQKSAMLSSVFGCYPMYNAKDVMSTPFFQKNATEYTKEMVRKYGLRNSQLLTIAPTGSLSTMLGISGGIEPIYANYYERKTESLHGKDVYYKVYTPIVDKYMKDHNIQDDSELPEWFVTAQTLDYTERIAMQAAWQKYIDASISSTVNVPNDFTVEQVENLYMTAWEAGLKGITIFRDGCKRGAILSTSNHDTSASTKMPLCSVRRGDIIEVNDDVVGKKRKLTTGCGSLHCTAFFDPDTGELLETYLSKGSEGGCNNFMIALSRMISLASRSGCDIHSIVDQLHSCGSCPSYAVRSATKHDTSKGACCPMAVGNALIDMYNEMQEEIGSNEHDEDEKRYDIHTELENVSAITPEEKSFPKCPNCGEKVYFEGGCNICKNCGWSKCD